MAIQELKLWVMLILSMGKIRLFAFTAQIAPPTSQRYERHNLDALWEMEYPAFWDLDPHYRD